jgi:TolA-binding protein
MNDPKRLVAEFQSPLMNELLHAAQREQLPDELRHRMAQGLALTLGGASLGAGIAGSSQLPAAIAGTQQAGVLTASGSTTASVAGTGLGGTSTATGVSWLGATWANTAVWIKMAVAIGAVTGAAGIGSWLGGWPQPSSAPAASNAIEIVEPPANGAVISDGTPAAPLVAADEEPSIRETRPKVARPKVKAGRSGLSEQPVAELQGDLGREVRLLDAARRAIISGNLDSAREKLAQYSKAFPNGSLRAEAASLAKAAAGAK